MHALVKVLRMRAALFGLAVNYVAVVALVAAGLTSGAAATILLHGALYASVAIALVRSRDWSFGADTTPPATRVSHTAVLLGAHLTVLAIAAIVVVMTR